MVELLCWTDAERGGFFAVKWAKAHEIGAAFFKLNMAAYNVYNVSTR